MPIRVDTVTDLNPVDVALLAAASEEEDAYQRSVLTARKYHVGDQAATVTDRLREFLPSIELGEEFRLNICRVIISAMTERIRIIGWDSSLPDKITWASDIFDDNKGPLVELDLYESILRDGEAFVIVDVNQETSEISWHVNPRYISLEIGDGEYGSGYGCKAWYENDDPNQRLMAVTKEWATMDDKGRLIRFRNIYHPDRIVKQQHNGRDFITYDTLDWKDSAGKPLGIAAVHFHNKGFKREAEDAYTPQDGINKTFLDLLQTSDLAAFRIFVALGWIPTTDGKEPAEDRSNWMPVEPGALLGTTKSKNEASFTAIEPTDPAFIINTVQQIILWASMVTNTPASRFIATKLIASDETLKQQEEPLVAKIDAVKTLLGYSWRQVFSLTERIWNILHSDKAVAEGKVRPIWCHSASLESLMSMLKDKQELGIPQTQIWREMGYDQQKIDAMKKEKKEQMIEATPDGSTPQAKENRDDAKNQENQEV